MRLQGGKNVLIDSKPPPPASTRGRGRAPPGGAASQPHVFMARLKATSHCLSSLFFQFQSSSLLVLKAVLHLKVKYLLQDVKQAFVLSEFYLKFLQVVKQRVRKR